MIRLLLVLGCLVLFALLVLGMRQGWRHRAARQSNLPPLPSPPTELGAELVGELTGLYVGSTVSTRWQDRIVAHGLGERAEATARLSALGVLIDRHGAAAIFVPADQLVDARLEPALAGKVVGAGGLLVLRWQHGEVLLDTGIRADDKTSYPAWTRAIQAMTEQRQETDAS